MKFDLGSPKRRKKLLLASAAAAAMFLGGLAGPAQAADGASQERTRMAGPTTAVAARDPENTSSIDIDDGKTCGQSRKRLFVEGEGWIVRRVTTCY